MKSAASIVAAYPPALAAPGSAAARWVPLLAIAELPTGSMHRVTLGDLDLLVAHTSNGVVVTDDRCPHMAAPLSLGELDGCVVACPLHEGRFNFGTGEPEQMPTTGGLDPGGRYHPPWTPGGREGKPDIPGRKAEARHLTRVRRFRYYPIRVVDGVLEGAIPVAGADGRDRLSLLGGRSDGAPRA